MKSLKRLFLAHIQWSRRRMSILSIIFVSLALPLGGCSLNVSMVNHDEAKAEERGRTFLEDLYVRKNYRGALRHFDSDLRMRMTEASLKQLVTSVVGEFGPVTSVEYDRFLPVLGKKSAVVMFMVIHKTGKSYQRVSLRGDSSGYLVEHISYSGHPFGE